MKTKLSAILVATLMSITMFVGMTTVIAQEKEQIDYSSLISEIEINEGLDLKIVLIIDTDTGYKALLANSDQTEYHYAIVDGMEFELEELKLTEETMISDDPEIKPIDDIKLKFGLITDVTGGAKEKVYGGSKSTVYNRESWVAGTNMFGVVMFEVHAKGQFFVDGGDIYYINDQSWESYDTFWYDRLSWDHDANIFSGGDYGLIDADALYDAKYHFFEYQVWAWVQCYSDGYWTYDYGIEEL
jgi:hypothetical protein